ncbi:MAG: hypothetical protein AB1346_05855 [Thermodesulfobacteriota bacterium]
MKKTICILLALGMLAAFPYAALAGGRGGGHFHGHGHGFGGFFAGLVGGAILGTIITSSQPAVVYSAPPPPVYVPQERVWIPGRYEMRYERQWVPGYWSSDGYSRVWVSGRYENVRVEVWVPGHWEVRG